MHLKAQVQQKLSHLNLAPTHADRVEASFQTHRPVYHNEEHCYSTALTFYELAKTARLSFHLISNGFIAALYHDANHQEDPDDRINISRAIHWYSMTPTQDRVGLSDPLVTWLIRATLNTLKDFKHPVEGLIHDADVLQTVKSTDAQENELWMARLSQELSMPVDRESSLTFAKSALVTQQGKDLLELASNLVD